MPFFLETKELLSQADLKIAAFSALVVVLISLPNVWLAVLRYRDENAVHWRAERALRRLIKANGYPFVAFRIIRHHIGGFDDDELRRMLVRAGAVRFADPNHVEHWALLSTLPRADRADLMSVTLRVSTAPPSTTLFPVALRSEKE